MSALQIIIIYTFSNELKLLRNIHRRIKSRTFIFDCNLPEPLVREVADLGMYVLLVLNDILGRHCLI